ncbi:hypothetical protein JKP88DRAFT_292410 [Tribonema minus]|uniref:NADPH--hemoprotein reductase n=1 Tax=Tribonema minus TaxID=303371 RepID=A0A835ZFF6_9STRA|nr:hypothetical protein JKP88DRAFT_292410 [Tribonema minus]
MRRFACSSSTTSGMRTCYRSLTGKVSPSTRQLKHLGRAATSCQFHSYRSAQRCGVTPSSQTPLKQQRGLSSAALAEEPISHLAQHPLVVCFGSQTGTAQMLSEDMSDHAAERGLSSSTVIDMRDIQGSELVERCQQDGSILVFVVANFGRGEPTDNARAMYEFIPQRPPRAQYFMSPDRDAEPPLARLRYTVFGLGRSDAYPENYQRVGRSLYERLAALGATPVAPRGEGDAAKDIDDAAAEWEAVLWSALDSLEPAAADAAAPTSAPAKTAASATAAAAAPPQWLLPHFADLVQKCGVGAAAAASSAAACDTVAACTSANPCFARVVENRRLTPAQSPRTVHAVTLEGARLPYSTGDYLGVLAQNTESDAEAVLAGLSLNPEGIAPGPLGVTLGEAVKRRCDISGLPRRGLLRRLSPLATVPAHLLAHLPVAEGKDPDAESESEFLTAQSTHELDRCQVCAFMKMARPALSEVRVALQKLNVALLLREHPSLHLSAAQLLDLCPPIQPRFYSISSSALAQPQAISLTVGLHAFRTPSGRVQQGLSSHFLGERCAEGSEVGVFVQTSEFRLPTDPSRPVILVAAGTGIAPFKAFIDERAKQRAMGLPVGPTTLYFGAAAPNTNDLYREYFESLGPEVVQVKMAYSDSPAHPARFPQHLLADDAAAIYASITGGSSSSSGGALYICGHGLLGKGVRAALADVIARATGGAARAPAVLTEWSLSGRFFEDIFQ